MAGDPVEVQLRIVSDLSLAEVSDAMLGGAVHRETKQ